MSDRLAPECAGNCGKQMDDQQGPWYAIYGQTSEHEFARRRFYLVCPDCEPEVGHTLIGIAAHDTEVVRLPDNSPGAVFALARHGQVVE